MARGTGDNGLVADGSRAMLIASSIQNFRLASMHDHQLLSSHTIDAAPLQFGALAQQMPLVLCCLRLQSLQVHMRVHCTISNTAHWLACGISHTVYLTCVDDGL